MLDLRNAQGVHSSASRVFRGSSLSGQLDLFDKSSRNSYHLSMNAILSEKGQVTIPKSIRDTLGLVPGSVLDFSTEGGRLILRKIIDENPVAAWRGKGRLPKGMSVDRYLESVREPR
jgi:antitoxin PrlF